MAQAKTAYYQNINQKLSDPSTDTKQYWHLLKSLYGTKIDSGIPSIVDGDLVISSAKEKAELFNNISLRNQFFLRIFQIYHLLNSVNLVIL